jgi:hypothetical protein
VTYTKPTLVTVEDQSNKASASGMRGVTKRP